MKARGQKRTTQQQGAGSHETSKAPHSVEKGDNQEAGGSESEASLAGEKQLSAVGASRTDVRAITSGTTRSDTPRSLPESGKTVKRQRSLNERYVGRKVRKAFRIRRKVRGKAVTVWQRFEGVVRAYDAKRAVFDILYEDNDEEEVDFLELGDILIMGKEFGDKNEHKGMTRAEVSALQVSMVDLWLCCVHHSRTLSRASSHFTAFRSSTSFSSWSFLPSCHRSFLILLIASSESINTLR